MTRFVRWFHVFLLVVILGGTVVQPMVAVAQTSLPQTGADSGGGFNSAGPSDIANDYFNSTNQWISAITPVATALFWALAGIDITWTCITLVLQHQELYPWMGGFIRKILTIGFFATLLSNGSTWIADIVNFFISLGSTAGGTSVSSLSASSIMGQGIQIAGAMLGGAAGVANTNASSGAIGLLTGGMSSLAPTIILALGAFFIVIAYVIIALHFVIAMVEAYVTVGAGYIFLGFGGSRWTVPYTEKYIGMVVSAGVRIMVLELLLGLGSTLSTTWMNSAQAIANVPDILEGGTAGGTWTGVQAEFALVASIAIFGLLCWQIPQIAANVVAGGLSMSGGDAMSASAALATGAMAGAAMATPSRSNEGSSADVAAVAQAAAMKGAEMGVQLAAAAAAGAATGGAGAVAVETGSVAAGAGGVAAGGAGVATPPPPGPVETGGGGMSSGVTPPGDNSAGGSFGPGVSDAPGSGDGGVTGTGSESGDAAVAGSSDKSESGTNSNGNGGSTGDADADVAKDAATVAAKGGASSSSAEAASAASASDSSVPPPAGEKGTSAADVVQSLRAGMQQAERAINQMPEDGGHIAGSTPNISHGEGE